MVAVVQLIGCTYVPPSDPAAADCTFDDINRALQGQTVHVQLASGGELHAENVHVAPFSTTLTVVSHGDPFGRPPPSPTRRDMTLDSSAIRTLTISGTERGSTAARGFRNGFLIGVAAGALLGATTYEPGLLMPSSRLEFAAILGGVGGVVFGGAGLALGAIAGTDEVYDLSTRAPDGSVVPRRR